MQTPPAVEPRADHTPEGFDAIVDLSSSPRFTALSAASWLALRRARSNWRILIAVAADLLLVVTLLCVIPLYTNLLTAIELQSQLSTLPIGGRNVDVTISHTSLTSDLQTHENQLVSKIASSTLARFAPGEPTNYIVMSPMPMTLRNDTPPPNYAELQIEAFQNNQLIPHIRLLAGKALPATSGADAFPPALITQQMSQVDNVHVGDLVTFQSGLYFQETTVTARVVGIWIPRTTDDPFWNGHTFLSLPTSDKAPYIFPVLVPPTALVAMIPHLLQVIITQHWTFTIRTSALTPAQIPAVITSLTQFRTNLATALSHTNYIVGILTITGLDKTLALVEARQRQFALPVDSVGALTLGAALLLLAMVAHLFVDRDRALIATVRSRGASGAQILGTYISLIAFVGALATLAGAALALWLAPQFVLRIVSPAALRSASVTSAYLTSQVEPSLVVIPALACLLIAVGIAFWATSNTLQSNIRTVAITEADEDAKPFWQRFYLDVALAALCVVGYLDLAYFGAAQGTSAVTQQAPSLLLIVSPLLLLVAGALLLLRLFPLAAALWQRIATRSRGATGLLASTRLTRGQAQVTLQPLLAMLAIGVMALAVTYDVTVRQNATMQAAYEAGADVRLVETKIETPGADALIQSRLALLPGHPSVSSAYRGVVHTSAYWDIFGAQQNAADLLAIDPHTWTSTSSPAAWQPSYASVSLSSLRAQMVAHEPARSATMQPGTLANPLWAIVSRSFAQTLQHKVGDTVSLFLPDSTTQSAYFTIGAIVNDFPTLYPTNLPNGFIVTDESGFLATLRAQPGAILQAIGPNEYWLRTNEESAVADAAQRQSLQLDVTMVIARQSLETAILDTPALVGLRTLLIFGAVAIGLLTVLATGLQISLDARRRWTQLMTMRAIGVSQTQIAVILVSERLFAALFGAVGGLLAGWVLTTTTLPYLTIAASSAVSHDAPTVALATNPWLLALLITALVGAMLLETAVVSVRVARSPINLRTLTGEA